MCNFRRMLGPSNTSRGWSGMTSYQIQDGGRPPFCKSKIRNNSAWSCGLKRFWTLRTVCYVTIWNYWCILHKNIPSNLEMSSASGGLRRQTLYRGFAPGPHWGLLSPDPLFCGVQISLNYTVLLPWASAASSSFISGNLAHTHNTHQNTQCTQKHKKAQKEHKTYKKDKTYR